MLYFIFIEFFLPSGAFIHRQQQDICAVLLENKKKLVIGYFCDFVISELEEKGNLIVIHCELGVVGGEKPTRTF